MCLIVFAYKHHPEYPLIVAANRDEFYSRPTQPAHWWEEAPHVLAGRDLKAGGTWMGLTRRGRFSAITNYREPHKDAASAPTRGLIASAFLTEAVAIDHFAEELQNKAPLYNGFNLLFGDADELCYFSNRGQAVQTLRPGVYGLSNHLLDTPWPKLQKAKAAFEAGLKKDADEKRLLEFLSSEEKAPDQDLPDTGVGLELERLLSSAFIKSPNYGTRVSTVIRIGRDGRVSFTERTYHPERSEYTFERQTFTLD